MAGTVSALSGKTDVNLAADPCRIKENTKPRAGLVYDSILTGPMQK